jgi:UDP-glucose 4-epimerase
MGTVNMLEAARKQKVARFVFSSSIYVYSNQGSFYRTSKQACEHLIHDYQERYGLSYTILRFGSLYGPRADASNSVHRMLRQAITEGRIDYAGSGAEIREYIHILDGATMSVDILDKAYENQIIHLAGRERITTKEMLELIKEMMGGRIEIGLKGEDFAGHYVQTPYSYVPKLGRRMTRNTYIDLGLGLLDCLQAVDQQQDEPAAVAMKR